MINLQLFSAFSMVVVLLVIDMCGCERSRHFVDYSCIAFSDHNSTYGKMIRAGNNFEYKLYDIYPTCSGRVRPNMSYIVDFKTDSNFTIFEKGLAIAQFLFGDSKRYSHSTKINDFTMEILIKNVSVSQHLNGESSQNESTIACTPNFVNNTRRHDPCQGKDQVNKTYCSCGYIISNTTITNNSLSLSYIVRSVVDLWHECSRHHNTNAPKRHTHPFAGGFFFCEIPDRGAAREPMLPPSLPPSPVTARLSADHTTLLLDFASDLLVPSQWLISGGTSERTKRQELLSEWGWTEGDYVNENTSPYIDCGRILSANTMSLLVSGGLEMVADGSAVSSKRVMKPLCIWSNVQQNEIEYESLNAMNNPTRLMVFIPKGAALTAADNISFEFSLAFADENLNRKPLSATADVKLDKQIVNAWQQYEDSFAEYDLQWEEFISQEMAASHPESSLRNYHVQIISTTWPPSVTPIATTAPSCVPSITPSFVPSIMHAPVNFSFGNNIIGMNTSFIMNMTNATIVTNASIVNFTSTNSSVNSSVPGKGTYPPDPSENLSYEKRIHIMYSTIVTETDVRHGQGTLKVRAPRFVHASCTGFPCREATAGDPLSLASFLTLDASASIAGWREGHFFVWTVETVTRLDTCSSLTVSSVTSTSQELLSSLQQLREYIAENSERGLYDIMEDSEDILRIPLTLLIPCTSILFGVTMSNSPVDGRNSTQVRVNVLPYPVPLVTLDGNYITHRRSLKFPLHANLTGVTNASRSDRSILSSLPLNISVPFHGKALPVVVETRTNRTMNVLTVDSVIEWNPRSLHHLQPLIEVSPPFSTPLEFLWELFELADPKIDHTDTFSDAPAQASLLLSSFDRVLSIPVGLLQCSGKVNAPSGCTPHFRYAVVLTVTAGNTTDSQLPRQSFTTAVLTVPPTRPHARVKGGNRCAHQNTDNIILDGSTSSVYSDGDDIFPQAKNSLTFKWSCWHVDSNYLDTFNTGNSVTLQQQCTSDSIFSDMTHSPTLEEVMRTETRTAAKMDGCNGWAMTGSVQSLTGKAISKPFKIDTTHPKLTIPRYTLQPGSNYKICLDVRLSTTTDREHRTYYNEKLSTGIENHNTSRFCVGLYVLIADYSTDSETHDSTKNMSSKAVSSKAAHLIPSYKTDNTVWSPLEIFSPFVTPTSDRDAEVAFVVGEPSHWMNVEYPLRIVVEQSPSGIATDGNLLGTEYSYPFCRSKDSSVMRLPNVSWSVKERLPSVFDARAGLLPESRSKFRGMHFYSLSSSTTQEESSLQVSYARNLFTTGSFLSFSLAADCGPVSSTQRGYSQITVKVRSSPRHGVLTVRPKKVVSFESKLTMRQQHWLVSAENADALPLQYSFYSSPEDDNAALSLAYPLISTVTPNVLASRVGLREHDICMREFLAVPHATVIAPYVSVASSVNNSANDTASFGCSNVVVSGYVRDSFGGTSVRRVSVLVCPKWAIDTDDVLSTPIESTTVSGSFVAEYVQQVADTYLPTLVNSKSAVAVAALTRSLALVLNDASSLTEGNTSVLLTIKRTARDTLLLGLRNASTWLSLEGTMHNSSSNAFTGPVFSSSAVYPGVLGHSLTEIVSSGEELREDSRGHVLDIVERIVSFYLSTMQSRLSDDGYARDEVCTGTFYSQRRALVGYLLQSLDNSGPLVNRSIAVSTSRERHLSYSKSVLGLKRVLVGCLLPGESIDKGRYFIVASLEPTAPLANTTNISALNLTWTNSSNYGGSNSSNTSLNELAMLPYNISIDVRSLSTNDSMITNLTSSTMVNASHSFLDNSTHRDVNTPINLTDSTISIGNDTSLTSVQSNATNPFPNITNSTQRKTNTTEITNSTFRYANHPSSYPTSSPTQISTHSEILDDLDKEYVVHLIAIAAVDNLYFGGSQIAAVRQSFVDLSEASVELGQNIAPGDKGSTNPPVTLTGQDIAVQSLSSMSDDDADKTGDDASKETNQRRDVISFLRLPCESSDVFSTSSNQCEDLMQFLSKDNSGRHEVSMRNAVLATSGDVGYFDIAIINVAQFLGQSGENDADFDMREIRSWIPPLDSDQGASDAIIAELTSHRSAFFNISRSVEISIKISRQDVFWELVTTYKVSVVDEVKSEGSDLSVNGDDSNDVEDESTDGSKRVFTPRWVRCERYDVLLDRWMQPSWLDGWWSPDVVSFSTGSELKEAAMYHRLGVEDLADKPPSGRKLSTAAGGSIYLGLNTSLTVMPTALSCFVNALRFNAFSTDHNNEPLMLQWRVVTKSSDPCGGCSGHGVCVLYRTAPVCLCDDTYTGRFCDEKIRPPTANYTSTRSWHFGRPFSTGGLRGILLLCAIFFVCAVVVAVGNKICFARPQDDDESPFFDMLHASESVAMTSASVIPSHTALGVWLDGSVGNEDDISSETSDLISELISAPHCSSWRSANSSTSSITSRGLSIGELGGNGSGTDEESMATAMTSFRHVILNVQRSVYTLTGWGFYDQAGSNSDDDENISEQSPSREQEDIDGGWFRSDNFTYVETNTLTNDLVTIPKSPTSRGLRQRR